MPATIEQLRSKRKVDRFANHLMRDRCKVQQKRKRIKCDAGPLPVYTPGGRGLAQSLRVPLLEREVSQLREAIKALMSLVGERELAAAQKLAKITPANETLKLWVDRSNTYPEIASQSEERPW